MLIADYGLDEWSSNKGTVDIVKRCMCVPNPATKVAGFLRVGSTQENEEKED